MRIKAIEIIGLILVAVYIASSAWLFLRWSSDQQMLDEYLRKAFSARDVEPLMRIFIVGLGIFLVWPYIAKLLGRLFVVREGRLHLGWRKR